MAAGRCAETGMSAAAVTGGDAGTRRCAGRSIKRVSMLAQEGDCAESMSMVAHGYDGITMFKLDPVRSTAPSNGVIRG